MGSQLRALSPDRIHRPRHHGFRLVPADRTAGNPTAAPGDAHAAKEQPAVKPASRSGWRSIALPVLAVVVIAEGGFLAYWFVTGRAAAKPESGSVAVTSDPSGSPVSIDGVSRGITPFAMTVSPGLHEIAVGAGAQLRSQSVNVTSGGVQTVKIRYQGPLKAPIAKGQQVAQLVVTTSDAGEQVMPLVAAEAVEEAGFFARAWIGLKQLFGMA